jgi:Smg protein
VNENVIDVLIYIYETYMDGDQPVPPDQIIMQEELLNVGFQEGEITKAFDWLDELAWRQGMLSETGVLDSSSMRIYAEQEMLRLDSDARGMLLFLEQNGILDPISRELVIERAMALGSNELDIDDIQWIVLLVLVNQPGMEAAFTVMQDMVYDGIPDLLH